MKTKQYKKDIVKVITLGCSKNLVDSENIITQLDHEGFIAEHETDIKANVIIINTCGFIDDAKEESVDMILQYARAKNDGEIDRLFVVGCLVERYKEDLGKSIPEVDGFFGTLEMPALLNRFNVDYKHELIGERKPTTPRHYAYLKISEGCSRTCAFCAIPQMRGGHVSRTIESLVEESKNLASKGIKEIILIAQELTYYGLDIYGERSLPNLMRELTKVEGIEWIRLHYAYPDKFPSEIFDVMRDNAKICDYIDIPLQHVSDNVLKRMKRFNTFEDTKSLIEYARKTVPGINIRTTLLVGFPGESEDDFEQLVSFVEEMKFDRLGVFEYSHEEGTPAFVYDDDIPKKVKSERAKRVMDVQSSISLKNNEDKIGRQMTVIIDRKEGEFFIGRTQYDSPEVDNEVLIPAHYYCRIGDVATIEIIEASEYDLIGKIK